MRKGNMAAFAAALVAFAACTFENDMSYPPLQGKITSFSVEGQKNVTINDEAQTVDVLLEETAEISTLKVTSFEITETSALIFTISYSESFLM